MPFDPNAADLVVGIVGTGAMGRGIAQVAAQGGMRVRAFDENRAAATAAKDHIGRMLDQQVQKGRLAADAGQAALARISLADDLTELAQANVIIEAVVERLEVKQALFAKLDSMTEPDTILASNTSSIPITVIAAACQRPERVCGMHFFNPVPLMRLVEIIPGLKTATWVSDVLASVGRRMARQPVLCSDSPAFLVNHVGRAFVPEAQRLLTEGIASPADMDRILTGAPGFRIGPFALADLVGIDVQQAVMESIYGLFYHEPAFSPFPVAAQRVAAGLWGQKTGAGWFRYQNGKKIEPPLLPAPTARPQSVWLQKSAHHPELQAPLLELFTAAGVSLETGGAPSGEALIVVTPIGYDLTTAVVDLKLDAARAVAIDVLFGMKGPRTLMVTPATHPAFRDAAHGLLAADGQPVVVINDSPGFVAQRVVAMIVNIGCGVAQRGIASPADIDNATKLGLSVWTTGMGGSPRGQARPLHPRAPAGVLCGTALPPEPLAEAPRRARPGARHARGARLELGGVCAIRANDSASAKACRCRWPAVCRRAPRTRWN